MELLISLVAIQRYFFAYLDFRQYTGGTLWTYGTDCTIFRETLYTVPRQGLWLKSEYTLEHLRSPPSGQMQPRSGVSLMSRHAATHWDLGET